MDNCGGLATQLKYAGHDVLRCRRSNRYAGWYRSGKDNLIDAGMGRQRRPCFMAWIYLLIAGLVEIVWALGLKYTQGFSRLGCIMKE